MSGSEEDWSDWANLDPVIGSEISKTRPVVVVSDNMMNQNLQTVIVCPLTTSLHPGWRSRIQITLKDKESEIAIDKVGNLTAFDALKVRILITEMYGES